MGMSNTGGVGKNRDFRRISGYRSMTGGVRTTTVTVHRAVNCANHHASVNLCLSRPAWTTTTKKTEQNVFVCSSKSEAEVTSNRRLHLTYCTIKANY